MVIETVIGERVNRVDGVERITGRATYGADVYLLGMLYAKVLRSPHAHAGIKRIDYSKALKLWGVQAVVTAGDLKALARKKTEPVVVEKGVWDPGHEEEHAALTERPNAAKAVFAEGKALWVGQPVAAVAAVSSDIAEEALKLIDVEYEVLTPVLEVEEAMKPDAPLLHANLYTETLREKPKKPSNVATHVELGRGDVNKGFKQADVVIEGTYRTAMLHQGFVELRTTVVKTDPDGKVTVWSGSQGIFEVQKALSDVLGLPLSSINVIPTEVGGGFGAKSRPLLEPIALLLSMKTGKPVKMTMNRKEEFMSGKPVPPSVVHMKMGATKDGKVVAAEMKVIMGGGAFPGGPIASATTFGLGYYNIPNVHIEGFDVVINKPPTGAFRAPGAPQAAFAVESHMNRLAEALKMDPLELRLKNVSQEGDLLPTGVKLPAAGFKQVLEAIRDHTAWKKPLQGANRGRGIACGMWAGGRQPTSDTIKVNSDGTLTLLSGVTDLTGTRTTFVQMIAHEFGLPPSEVRIPHLDSDTAPYTAGTYGSKTTYVGSVALKNACDQVKAELIKRGATRLDLPEDQVEYVSGKIQSKKDRSLSVTLKELASLSVTTGLGPIVKTGIVPALPMAPCFSAHVVDLEADPDTGKMTILKYTVFQDAGKAINPSLIEGQMQGAAVQGIGWALSEGYYYQNGTLQNTSFLDYRMPTAYDVPLIDTVIIEVPNPTSPYGVRGVAEACLVPAMAAIANAVYEATGKRLTELPMTPDKVLAAQKK